MGGGKGGGNLKVIYPHLPKWENRPMMPKMEKSRNKSISRVLTETVCGMGGKAGSRDQNKRLRV